MYNFIVNIEKYFNTKKAIKNKKNNKRQCENGLHKNLDGTNQFILKNEKERSLLIF